MMTNNFNTKNIISIFLRALSVWLVIICAETLHGTARTLFLEPFFGDFRARQIAVFSGAFIILTIAFLFVRWLRTENNFQLLLIGFFWLVLTLLFEISLGRFVLNLSWERVFSDYNLLEGGLLGFGLLTLLFSPLIAFYFRYTSPHKRINSADVF